MIHGGGSDGGGGKRNIEEGGAEMNGTKKVKGDVKTKGVVEDTNEKRVTKPADLLSRLMAGYSSSSTSDSDDNDRKKDTNKRHQRKTNNLKTLIFRCQAPKEKQLLLLQQWPLTKKHNPSSIKINNPNNQNDINTATYQVQIN